MRTWTAAKKKVLSLWQTVLMHRYCHRSWGIKINYVTQLLAFQQTLPGGQLRLWVKLASVWARNQDGPKNLCRLASADSKSPESAVWPSRQCLPVLGSFLCCIPQLRWLLDLWSTPLLINWRLPMMGFSASRKGLSSALRWHLTILRWAGITYCTLTMGIMWLSTLIIHYLGLMTILLHIRR